MTNDNIELLVQIESLKEFGRAKMTTKQFNTFALLDCVDGLRRMTYIARGNIVRLEIESVKLSPGVYALTLKGFDKPIHGIR
jgi:hypothetical protein